MKTQQPTTFSYCAPPAYIVAASALAANFLAAMHHLNASKSGSSVFHGAGKRPRVPLTGGQVGAPLGVTYAPLHADSCPLGGGKIANDDHDLAYPPGHSGERVPKNADGFTLRLRNLIFSGRLSG